jgi:mannan endo-1,4-beta-mannosidase
MSSARLAIPALLVALAVLVGAAPAAAKHKVALGVAMEAGQHDIAAYDEFKEAVGRQPAILTLWSQWGQDATKAFPTQKAQAVWDRGATPMIWWEPVIPPRERERDLDCPYSRWSRVVAGEHDKYIRQWANQARRFGKTVLLRLAHEINGNYFPWGINSQCGNTAKAYKQAWKRIHGIFKARGATNVKFVWTVAKQKCQTKGCNPYKRFYPGDKFVDYAGFSSFNWGAYKGAWTPMLEGVRITMGHVTAFTKKPIILAELASNTDGGDKAQWIRDGYPAVYKRYHNIRAIVYLNEDLSDPPVNHPDWSLDKAPGAHEAYGEIAKQPRFRGQIRK